jgi:hypothetical protein
VSPDAEKINTIHSPTGNQYFMNPLNLGTPDESGIWRIRQPKIYHWRPVLVWNEIAKSRRIWHRNAPDEKSRNHFSERAGPGTLKVHAQTRR